jgi:antitoxin (DNA-binding transcriptional repressor) of toxin-antitoxin stability system
MRTIGIKLLKDKLSEYLRIAGTGETILVTDRDRVVAEIGPPRAGRADRVSDAVVGEGIRRGWITPRRYPAEPVPDIGSARRPLADVLADLDRDREDR